MADLITSRQNPTYKQWLSWSRGNAAANRELREAGLCWLEGEHLIDACARSGGELQTLITDTHTHVPHEFAGIPHTALTTELLGGLLQQADGSAVIGLARVPTTPLKKKARCVLALDGVQDPGNVGAILRSAAAFGVDEVWLSKGCAWAWSAKTLRASQGCQFGLSIHEELDLASELQNQKRPVLAMNASAADDLAASDLREPLCLVVGSEGQGVSAAVSAKVTGGLRIPMSAGVESLNAAVACSLVLYERQRQLAQ